MRAAASALALGLLLLVAAREVRGEVRSGSFSSTALGREVAYVVDVPASYDAAGARKYPVVYALHGLFEGSGFWERRGLAPILAGLRETKAVPEFLVVAVDGGNSFFVNSPAVRYEDMVTKDLVAHVEKAFRVVPGRKGRALLGVSMGGYAALHVAFDQPSLYAAVANDYVFYGDGGWSWCVPWIAGLYALACEVKPDITPEQFWAAALKTGETIQIQRAGVEVSFGPIANPVALIESLRRGR